MRVLIVEDEIRIRNGMANLIEHHTEHTVIGEAQNGQEGLEMALLYMPDLIITDIRMPVMDGLEMMRKLREQDGDWHFVILSGYSEFEYAKKAIQYGADDYLIKPLAPDDVMNLLDSIQQRIKKESLKKQEKPEHMLRNYLIEKEEIPVEKLQETCGFKKNRGLQLVCAYVGNISQNDRNDCIDRMKRFQVSYPEEKIYYFFMESTRELIVLVEETKWEFLKNELEKKLLSRKAKDKIWVWTTESMKNFTEFREKYEQLRKIYQYGLVLNTGEVLDQEKAEQFISQDTVSFQKNKKAIHDAFYQKDKKELGKEITIFLEEIDSVQMKPQEIREEYIQMMYFILNLTKENNSGIYEQILKLNPVQNIGNSVTRHEIKVIFSAISQILISNLDERQNISNYIILRAITYIRNHYQEGVSLEEVADSLDITPEYLSTLFNREMGENFTSFLKKFRMSHAKRLLRSTDKKISDIAFEVGYSDPKYFSRVFKTEEGISPGEYRTLNI